MNAPVLRPFCAGERVKARSRVLKSVSGMAIILDTYGEPACAVISSRVVCVSATTLWSLVICSWGWDWPAKALMPPTSDLFTSLCFRC